MIEEGGHNRALAAGREVLPLTPEGAGIAEEGVERQVVIAPRRETQAITASSEASL